MARLFPEKPKSMSAKVFDKAFDYGYDHAVQKKQYNNPHDQGTDKYKGWRSGFCTAMIAEAHTYQDFWRLSPCQH